ncbi:2,3-dihydro-2,3-dihydroxybenzoate dehydrogenase [Lysobacter silvisoli]|uniref:2,3-dihydro-2,3-dihydroxybenzoate dehydrogenase n=1 Tax=Lysobacter silvisoli TaxID=2293254 RepID=A0A371JZX3_9GAMM|nr:2,3-dihydro-2,3-dihydroxybenzoate dehydrogenase [Lysobacter silvisoli]RDZ27162.1 2,3-dihydro-2,3-dihydroxybenzoate dehydrogenase [Lysobacter silvisoli]
MSASPPLSEFDGRLILVTGAAQGIGAATALRLGASGARLALFDRDGDALSHTLAQLQAAGVRAQAWTVDLADAAATRAAIAEVEQDGGAIEHLAHVAGVLRTGALLDGADALADWDACMAVNARALVGIAQALAPAMARRRRGSIVVVGSNAASAPRIGMAAYAASKAAASQYLRCLALELAPHGVRCNLVSPGSTDTPMQRAFAADEAARNAILGGDAARFRLGIPLGRIAAAEDVAEAVCFLLSERARHITLHDLRVDGGATLDA